MCRIVRTRHEFRHGSPVTSLVLWLLSALLVLIAEKESIAQVDPQPLRNREVVAADLSEPKKTYESFLRAIKSNDLEAAKQCWHIDSKDPALSLEVITGVWVTAHRLSEVALNKLGAQGWEVMQEWNDIVCRSDCTDQAINRTLERLKGGKVATVGETATLTIEWAEDQPLEKPVFGYMGDDPVAEFRRVSGQWKLDASSFGSIEGTSGRMVQSQIKATQRIISELQKGNLRTAEETIAAFETNGERNPRDNARNLGPKLDQLGVPPTTHLESGGLAASTNHPPVMAISQSGVIYVFWPAYGQKSAAPTPELPPIPATYAFGNYSRPEFSSVPGVSVCRDGTWSKPGVLVEGLKNCGACFAWCTGEQLHLLVSDAVMHRTRHFKLNQRPRQWERVAELPYELTHYDAFRVVGETVHIGFVEHTAGALKKSYASYLKYDGQHWSNPLRIEQSDNASSHVTRVRLAVDGRGVAHLAWWSGEYGYAVIRDGKVTHEPLRFAGTGIEQEEFDVGIDPRGRPMIAYKPDLPKDHPDARKVFIRRRANEIWLEPEKIGGEGEALFGSIRIVWAYDKTLVTWVCREEYTEQGGVLVKGFRRFSIDDGATWSPSRWMARFPRIRGNGTPISANDLGVCVDRNGNVHICEETRHYGLVANLRNESRTAAENKRRQ